MAKNVTDDLSKIYIWQLVKAGLFANPGLMAEIRYKNDIISYIWPSVRYTNYIQISFSDSSIRQTIKLLATPCYIPGERMWFECPYCKRRSGALYLSDLGYYSCRLCLGVSYESKNKNYRKKDYWLLYRFGNYFRANELSDQLKRFSYAGKPTKKMQRINYLYEHSIFL